MREKISRRDLLKLGSKGLGALTIAALLPDGVVSAMSTYKQETAQTLGIEWKVLRDEPIQAQIDLAYQNRFSDWSLVSQGVSNTGGGRNAESAYDLYQKSVVFEVANNAIMISGAGIPMTVMEDGCLWARSANGTLVKTALHTQIIQDMWQEFSGGSLLLGEATVRIPKQQGITPAQFLANSVASLAEVVDVGPVRYGAGSGSEGTLPTGKDGKHTIAYDSLEDGRGVSYFARKYGIFFAEYYYCDPISADLVTEGHT